MRKATKMKHDFRKSHQQSGIVSLFRYGIPRSLLPQVAKAYATAGLKVPSEWLVDSSTQREDFASSPAWRAFLDAFRAFNQEVPRKFGWMGGSIDRIFS